jgi:hypothetical protein
MSNPIDPIRAAVQSGDYTGARLLFDEHAARLRDRALAGEVDEQTLREVFELVEWTRRTALADRSHLEARIQSLREEVYVSRAYAPPRE